MRFAGKVRIDSNRARRIVELILVALGTKYLALLITMHVICPGSMQPFLIFAIHMAPGLIAVHFIKRLNWMIVMAALALPAWPFFGNMFLVMDSVVRRTVDYPVLHELMAYVHGYSFWAAVACMLMFIVGLVGGTGECIRDYRRARAGIEGQVQ